MLCVYIKKKPWVKIIMKKKLITGPMSSAPSAPKKKKKKSFKLQTCLLVSGVACSISAGTINSGALVETEKNN